MSDRLHYLKDYLDDPTVVSDDDPDMTIVAVPLDDLAWLVGEVAALRAENERIVTDVTAQMDAMVTEFTANIPLSPPDPEYDPNDEFKACAIDRADRAKRRRSRVTRVLHGLDPEGAQ